MIKIYGNFVSRTTRPLWLLEEMGTPYELIQVDLAKGEHKTPAYTALNPDQKIPTLVDGDLVLSESMAITYYLAEKYQSNLMPQTPEGRGKLLQWTFWSVASAEKPLLTCLFNRRLYPEDRRDPQLADHAEAEAKPLLSMLNQALEGREYLLEERFTLADLNTASVFSWARAGKMDLSPFPHVAGWLKACMARPGFVRATGRG